MRSLLVDGNEPQGEECEAHVVCEGQGQYIGYVVVLPLICATGAILNAINLLVFKQRGLKFHASTLILLKWMALMDFLTLAIVFNLGFCRCINNVSDEALFAQDIYEIYIFLPFSNMTACTSVWTTVILTLERYIFVAHPSVAKHISTRYNAKLTSFALLFASVILHFPYFFMQYPTLGDTPQYTEFGDSTGHVVYSWIRLIVAKMIPIIVVALVNSLLISSAWKAHHRCRKVITTQRAKQREKQQVRITIMTLCISTTFFICHFLEPLAHLGVQTSIFGTCSMSTVGYTTFLMMINIMENVSFSINFLFYCIFNQRFSEALQQTLTCKAKVDVISRSRNECSMMDHTTNHSTSSRRGTRDQDTNTTCIATIAK